MIGDVGVSGLDASDGTGGTIDESCATEGLKAAFGTHAAWPGAAPDAPPAAEHRP
jgi:hypothetical protein